MTRYPRTPEGRAARRDDALLTIAVVFAAGLLLAGVGAVLGWLGL